MIRELNLSDSMSHGGFIVKSSLHSHYQDVTSDKYSVKIPLKGSENYKIDSKPFHVLNKNFIITNPFQEVIGEVDSREKVDGLCIYINADIMLDVFFSSKNLFTDEDAEAQDLPLILAHTYAADFDDLGLFINSIKQRICSFSLPNSDEFFYDLSELILKKRMNTHFQYSKIEALKLSTKKELFRRLDTMYQIIRAHYKEAISLSELSQEVGLSKFHSIRLYKGVHGISPYKHIQKLRLEESKNLLKKHSITETGYILNFSDRRAFSKAFKRFFGISPSCYLKGAVLK